MTILAPDTEENREAAAKMAMDNVAFQLIAIPTARRGSPRDLIYRCARKVYPFVFDKHFHKALLADDGAAQLISDADIVELQWFEQVLMAPEIRARSAARIVGVYADILSQRLDRELMAPMRTLSRIAARVRLHITQVLERRVASDLDLALTLSEKDAAILEALGAYRSVKVIDLPVAENNMPQTVTAREVHEIPEVLFVGAMFRPENDDAATWLLQEIWPQVLQRQPRAQLVIAGARPSERLRQACEKQPSVRLTGYVESLTAFYRTASVAVSPLRYGAGVKVKSIAAMLWGIPVVATPVGSEGIPRQEVFAAVTESAEDFAIAVCRILEDDDYAHRVAAEALAWAGATYTEDAYTRRIEQLYRNVLVG